MNEFLHGYRDRFKLLGGVVPKHDAPVPAVALHAQQVAAGTAKNHPLFGSNLTYDPVHVPCGIVLQLICFTKIQDPGHRSIAGCSWDLDLGASVPVQIGQVCPKLGREEEAKGILELLNLFCVLQLNGIKPHTDTSS